MLNKFRYISDSKGVKNEDNLQHSFKRVSFSHVPREMNRQADLLVNQVIDEAMK